jgi:hypothetical protein
MNTISRRILKKDIEQLPSNSYIIQIVDGLWKTIRVESFLFHYNSCSNLINNQVEIYNEIIRTYYERIEEYENNFITAYAIHFKLIQNIPLNLDEQNYLDTTFCIEIINTIWNCYRYNIEPTFFVLEYID